MFLKRLTFEGYLRKNHVDQKKKDINLNSSHLDTPLGSSRRKSVAKLPLKTKLLSSNKQEKVGVLLKREH